MSVCHLCFARLNLCVFSLNILQCNNDTEEVLKWINKSTRWSELDDYKLRLGLKVLVAFFHLLILKTAANFFVLCYSLLTEPYGTFKETCE